MLDTMCCSVSKILYAMWQMLYAECYMLQHRRNYAAARGPDIQRLCSLYAIYCMLYGRCYMLNTICGVLYIRASRCDAVVLGLNPKP